MSDLIVWLFVGGLVGMIFIYGWPIIVVVAALCACIWMMRQLAASIRADLDKHNAQITALIKRADTQHNQILNGDDIGGTYGEYQPPPALR